MEPHEVLSLNDVREALGHKPIDKEHASCKNNFIIKKHNECDKCAYYKPTTTVNNVYANDSIFYRDIILVCENYGICGELIRYLGGN